jgi:formylglycine-generating enzyme required for sulfatase activity
MIPTRFEFLSLPTAWDSCVPSLQIFLESVGRAVIETGWARTSPPAPIGDSLIAIIRGAHQNILSRFTPAELHGALREAVAAPQDTFDLELEDAVASIAGNRSDVNRAALVAFLGLIRPIVQQGMRRPGDILGASVPEQLPVGKPEDWLSFFPERLTRFEPEETLQAYDDWRLANLRGLGPYSEAWHGWSPGDGENRTAHLKFITVPRAARDFARHENHFRRILALESKTGLVRLRSVYLLADPPCLESDFLSGYDATALMLDWRWRNERCKPDHATLIVKRVARIVGHLHERNPPIVHRGLKPSNILLHPTAHGRVTVWVSDLGWGEIASTLAIERTEHLQARRQARRGALATRYVSPEQSAGGPPDPRDDVYALGVIWYQLLKRDPTAHAPQGFEWAFEFRKFGLSDGHACLLASCLDPNPDYRPKNGLTLAEMIDVHFNNGPDRRRDAGSSPTIHLPGGDTASARAAAALAARTELPRLFRNSIGMEFVLAPAGVFAMGSPSEEKGRRPCEGPAHNVTLSRPFYVGINPVTQAQYQQLMGQNPSYFTRALGGGPNHPVEQVSWDDAVIFCQRLMELAGSPGHGHIYRLPTEAEWEYACRAGTNTPYAFGESISLLQVHYFGLSSASWAKTGGRAGKTVQVGSHEPNEWGIRDMHGNVLEWCHDWWSEGYYEVSPDTDPQGPETGHFRVARGGSFSQFASECRSASRIGRAPTSRLNTIGFRVVMTVAGM